MYKIEKLIFTGDKKRQELADNAAKLLKEQLEMDERNEYCDEHDVRFELACDAFVAHCLKSLPAAIRNQVKDSKLYAAKVVDRFIFTQVVSA